jgi:hypothetical protein
VLNRQHLQASDQGLVVGEDGEISSCGDSRDENINGTALDTAIEAKVEETGGFGVIIRHNLLVVERF